MKKFHYQMVASHPKDFSLTYIFLLVTLICYISQGKLSFAEVTNLQIPKVYCSLSLQSDTGQSALLGGYLSTVVRFELLPVYNYAVSEFFVSSHSGSRENVCGAGVPFLTALDSRPYALLHLHSLP